MDLNYLFGRHQVSLMQEASAKSVEARLAHREMASLYADQIGVLQRSLSSTAALAATA